MALTNLEKVSASLGAKAMLWELFNLNPPTLRLYVELCSTSQFLSEILIGNPGMIDDLMDSLVADRSQPASAIRAELAELCRGAEDLAPILLSFRNKEWVRIGTRDILQREPIRDVTRELADVAEAIITQVANDQWRRRVARHGLPRRPHDTHRASWAILALGKLGGRELNYHSDLDVARRVLKALGGNSETGRLYSVDTRLRPFGSSGRLAVPLEALVSYLERSAQVWERMALTRARVVHARGGFGRRVEEALRPILSTPLEPGLLAAEVRGMRKRLEDSRGPNDLKRGFGGLADIEFLVQYLQLRDAYDFVRTVEGRLRIVHNRAVVDWPGNPIDLARLARRLNQDPTTPPDAVAFRADAARHASKTRAWFEGYVHV
jgi:glutamate-ammonia-ligase adenylyltransferase